MSPRVHKTDLLNILSWLVSADNEGTLGTGFTTADELCIHTVHYQLITEQTDDVTCNQKFAEIHEKRFVNSELQKLMINHAINR